MCGELCWGERPQRRLQCSGERAWGAVSHPRAGQGARHGEENQRTPNVVKIATEIMQLMERFELERQ